MHAGVFTADPSVLTHELVHSDPGAWLASQYWFAAHTSSPHVHAGVFSANPSVLEHAPQRA